MCRRPGYPAFEFSNDLFVSSLSDTLGGIAFSRVSLEESLSLDGITVGESPVTLSEISLLRGDTNGDNMVNIMDMSTFRQNFGKTAAKDCTVTQ